MIALIAALVTCAGTVAAALITTRRAGPAGTPSIYEVTAPGTTPPKARISGSLWLGLAGLVLWIVPICAYVLVIPGLYIGIRESKGPRRLTGPGIAVCAVSLALALINSAIGAYQGAHGAGWWQ